MRYLSLFSGIEATSVAWGPLGWEAAAFSEVDPTACAVLAHRYPKVPNLGDVRDIDGATLDPLGTIDLVAFGWPCQDLSVAGKRAGLRGERSGLFHEAVRVVRLLAGRNGCRWLVAENVPGLLSSEGGRDLAAIVRAITGLDVSVPAAGWGNSGVAASNDTDGWSLAWRCLDAQYFGVPQRRRRVFLVGHLGDWRRAAAVLFEPQSLWGDPPPRRAQESGPSPSVTPGARRASGNRSGELLAVAGSLTARYGKGADSDACDPMVVAVDLRNMAETGDVSQTLQVGTHGTSVNNTPHVFQPLAFAWQGGGKQTNLGFDPDQGTAQTLGRKQTLAIAFQERGRDGGPSLEHQSDIAYSLNAPSGGGRRQEMNIAVHTAVRRLTPRECERLQGFPDDHTLVPYRGKPMADGPRYRMLGNSMAVPVVRWIGERIGRVERIMEAIS